MNLFLKKWINHVSDLYQVCSLRHREYENMLVIREILENEKLSLHESRLLSKSDTIFKLNTREETDPHLENRTGWWWYRTPYTVGHEFADDLYTRGYQLEGLEKIEKDDFEFIDLL